MSALAPAASGAVPGQTTTPRIARAAILGARGYTGRELLRLALAHPGVEVTALVSREPASSASSTWLPGLDPRASTLPPSQGPADVAKAIEAGAIDTVISCLPHGAWRALQLEHAAIARAARIIDLSSDHRDGRDGYRYGLPEAFRDELSHATRIANPGCYATGATLALLPAATGGLLAGPIVLTGLSGVSGAGRGPSLHTSFVEVDGGASFYRVGEAHAHIAEIAAALARLAGAEEPPAIGFAPQMAPMTRGILLVANAPLARRLDPEEARSRWVSRYAGEPFIRVLPPGEWPQTHAVRGSNRLDLAVTTIHGGATLLVTAALDNLVKGAAGQALQNLNLQLGWPEDTGLPRHGSAT